MGKETGADWTEGWGLIPPHRGQRFACGQQCMEGMTLIDFGSGHRNFGAFLLNQRVPGRLDPFGDDDKLGLCKRCPLAGEVMTLLCGGDINEAAGGLGEHVQTSCFEIPLRQTACQPGFVKALAPFPSQLDNLTQPERRFGGISPGTTATAGKVFDFEANLGVWAQSCPNLLSLRHAHIIA